MKFIKEIHTLSSVFAMREDGIIESFLKEPHADKIELEEMKQMVEAVKDLSGSALCPLLSNMGDAVITDEARIYVIDNINISLGAAVGTSFIARMMANLIMNFKKLPFPAKLFEEKEVALAWINEHRSSTGFTEKELQA